MKLRIFLFSLLILLVACGNGNNPPPLETSGQESVATVVQAVAQSEQIQPNVPDVIEATPAPALPPVVTNTPIPTATARPVAAMVNDTPIFLDQFETRLAQFENWYPNGTPDGSGIRQYTIDNLVTQRLLEQTAAQNGIVVSAETVENAISEAVVDAGGDEAYRVWLSQNSFTEDTFRTQIHDEILAQAVVGFVTRDVPDSAEYVRARYIQVDDIETAQAVLVDLNAGGDFATLVDIYSVEPSKATTRGDLGYFRQGKLLVPIVEETAYAMQPEQISDVVSYTRADGSETFFIVQTIDRDPERKLDAGEYSGLLAETFEGWLADLRASADVLVTVE